MTEPIPKRLARVAYRYASGRPLDGVPRSDGGYLRRGTRGLDGPASIWAMLPGWRRQLVRLGAPAALYGAATAYTVAPAPTTASVALLTAVGGARGLVRLRRAWRLRRFRAVYIRPTLGALRPALGDAPVQLHVDPSLGALIPRLARPMSPAEVAWRAWYGEHVEPVLRYLPDRAMRGLWAVQRTAAPLTSKLDWFRRPAPEDLGPRIELVTSVSYLTDDQQRFISAVLGAKIPAGDLVETWNQVGPKVTATWTVRRRPPSSVGYADLAARFADLPEWEYFAGLGVGGRPVVISLRDDSPHIACSAGSGAGKSVLAQLVGTQVLARGGRVVILDLKGSHRWALGLPGVDYCTQADQQHDALIRLADLADQRNSLALHEEENWDPGERVFVIAEELNASFTRLKDYWDGIREKGESKTSPAVKAFRNLLFMGRSAKVNVFAVAQMLTANTTGGPESRENFGVRCLARYTRNNWQMLAPEAPMPKASRTLGRWQIVVGGRATEAQVCFLSPAESRLLVHKMSPTGGLSRGQSQVSGIKGVPAETGDVGDTTPDPLDARVSLREVVERGIAPWRYDAAKKRIQRGRANGAGKVPVPVGREGNADVYRLGDVIEWIEGEIRG